jgi:hypothetical protein
MARAGYCNACRNYVFLRPDGGCGNGHGAEYVSNPYDVPDAPGQAYQQPPAAPAYPATVAPPAYQPAAPAAYQPPGAPAAYQQPAYAAPAAPKKKRTGLIVTIAIVALLLFCGCGGVAAVSFGLIPSPLAMLASPEHQKVQVAGDFFKSVATADLVGLTRNIPSAAAAAANPAFWTEKVLTSTDKATFNSESWKGDVLTQEFTTSDGTKRSVTYTSADGDKVEATMVEDGQDSGDPVAFTMVKEAGGWKVLALGSGDTEFLRFTPEDIKKLEESN